MLTIQALTPQQVTQIYHRHMVRDFPADELKPLDNMLPLSRLRLVGGRRAVRVCAADDGAGRSCAAAGLSGGGV